LCAFGLGSIYMACNTMMAEFVPTKYRTTVLGTLQTAVTVGYIMAMLMASNIIPDYGWRMMFFASIIPGILALLLSKLVPESRSWQEAKITELKNKHLKISTEVHSIEKPVASSFEKIWKNSQHRKMFIFWILAAAFLQFGYYGINNWMPTFLESELNINLKSMTSFMIGSYTAMIVGKIIAGWASDKFGRKPTFLFGTVGTAICLPLIIFYNTPENIVYLLVGFGFLYGIPYGVNATYMAESFSTDVRGTAIGAAYNMGRIGGAIAPTIIGVIASGGSFTLAFVIMGIAYFVAGIIPGLFIRERQYDPQQPMMKTENLGVQSVAGTLAKPIKSD
jgi:MFS transporter, AAHS family, cis,cis-muconate transporter